MRNERMLVALAISLVSTGAGWAEPVPYTITATEVLVRSGPSPEFNATSRLHRGDKVLVRGQETTGWLAIVPPPGSFSWINARDIEQISSNQALVRTPNAPIRVGSRLVNQEPTVERVHVAVGTQVILIGKPEVARDGTWLPIRPVPSEARYIPAEAVRPVSAPPPLAMTTPAPLQSSPQTGSAVARPPAARPAAGTSAGSAFASASPSGSAKPTNPLWTQADEAERRGDIAQAKALLEQLAEQVKATDHELWIRCLNRLQALQESRRNGVSAQPPTHLLTNANAPPGATANRLVSSPAASTASPQTPRAASEYCYVRDSAGYTAHLTAPVLNAPTPPAAPAGQWYEPGRLYRTAFAVDGKQAYRYEPVAGRNRMWIYVTVANNVTLEPYVGRIVSLYGSLTYRADLQTYYLTVLQVTPVNSVR
jgi:hypothetical protein